MSYDLYFYKKRDSAVTTETMREYLGTYLVEPNEQGNQWWFENEQTEVYFSFETVSSDDLEDYEELFDSFEEYEPIGIMFNLNFVRPAFFGLEAFLFVEQCIKDLELYVLDPQSETNSALPFTPAEGELFTTWLDINLASCLENFGEESLYYSMQESNETWNYNYNSSAINEELGDEYFAPRVFLFKKNDDNKVIRLTTWTEHIPNVFPPFDYILLNRVTQQDGEEKEESGIISHETFMTQFGALLEEYSYPGCKIIHPGNAAKAALSFNSLPFEAELDQFAERIDLENLTNVEPE